MDLPIGRNNDTQALVVEKQDKYDVTTKSLLQSSTIANYLFLSERQSVPESLAYDNCYDPCEHTVLFQSPKSLSCIICICYKLNFGKMMLKSVFME